MTYNVHFEIAVFGFFLILFFVHSQKRQLPTIANTKFTYLLLAVLTAGLFSILRGMSNWQNAFGAKFSVFVNIGYTVACIVVIAIYFDYTMAVVCIRWNRTLRMLVMWILPLLACGIVVTTPWTGLCYRFDAEGAWHPGSMLYVIYSFFIAYLLGAAVYIPLRSKGEQRRSAFLVTKINLVLIATILQPFVFTVNFNLLNMATELGAFFYLMSVQGADFYLDLRTGRFNFDGFVDVLHEKVAYRKKAVCFLVRVRNFTAMSKFHSDASLQKVQRLMGEIIEANVNGLAIYHVGSATYAVIADSLEEVEEIHRKLRDKMPSQWFVNREAVSQEYSYYRVSYPDDSDNMQEIMQRIHYARSDHRGHHAPGELIHLQHQALQEAAERKQVAHLIEEAIMDNTLELHFQPIYSFAADRITSLEVLSRLKDSNKKYINPEYFIHIAEDNHTIKALSLQMFDKACSFAVRNRIFELGITDININLSPTHCCEKGAADALLAIAKKYQIPVEKLHFEITESKLTDSSQVKKTLQRLKDAGAKIALDDFGTGYSNLSSIQELPVDFVKIDKSLVWSYSDGKNQFLTELLPMIQAEGKKIIAEGIETEEHIEILREMCGDFLQGYFYSKPLPEEPFIRYLKEFNREYCG